jgi:hypothetical protein
MILEKEITLQIFMKKLRFVNTIMYVKLRCMFRTYKFILRTELFRAIKISNSIFNIIQTNAISTSCI